MYSSTPANIRCYVIYDDDNCTIQNIINVLVMSSGSSFVFYPFTLHVTSVVDSGTVAFRRKSKRLPFVML